MQRLKAYSVFSQTKDKRLLEFLKNKNNPHSKVAYQARNLKRLSIEHFLCVINILNDWAFLKEIKEIIRNSILFSSKYYLEKNRGKILMNHGFKSDFSLKGRVEIVLKKVKESLDKYE